MQRDNLGKYYSQMAFRTYYTTLLDEWDEIMIVAQEPQHWTNFAIGRSEYLLSAVASVRDSFIRVEFNITGENAKTHFDQLREQYEDQASVAFGSDLGPALK